MSFTKLKENISLLIENKKDEDVINQLYFLKQSIGEVKVVLDKEFTITFDQLKKSSDKLSQSENYLECLEASMNETEEPIKDEDIIMSMVSMSKVLSNLEQTINGTGFEIGLIYQKTKTPPKEEKVEVKKEEKVVAKKTVSKKKETPTDKKVDDGDEIEF